MKVQIRHHTRGHAPGDVVDVDDRTARILVSGGRAVRVDDNPSAGRKSRTSTVTSTDVATTEEG